MTAEATSEGGTSPDGHRGVGSGDASARPAPLTPAMFAERFQEVSRVLWCVAAATQGQRAHADDIVQEAALIGLRKLDQFEVGTSFVAWMSQIVRHVALNDGRRRQRRATHASDPLTIDASHPGADPSGPAPVTSAGILTDGQDAFGDEVVHAMMELSEPARCCLLLRTVLGLSYAEISRALNIPEGTAMSHVHRARAAMRHRLDPPPPGGKGGPDV